MNCKKTVARITYTVLVETLNPAQSINEQLNQRLCLTLMSLPKDSHLLTL